MPDLKDRAAYVRGEVRNKWAHQAEMDAAFFKMQMDAVTDLVAGMARVRLEKALWDKAPMHQTRDAESDEGWVKVDQMMA